MFHYRRGKAPAAVRSLCECVHQVLGPARRSNSASRGRPSTSGQSPQACRTRFVRALRWHLLHFDSLLRENLECDYSIRTKRNAMNP